MHDGRAGLVVLGLGDPHRLERGQRREDGAADPGRRSGGATLIFIVDGAKSTPARLLMRSPMQRKVVQAVRAAGLADVVAFARESSRRPMKAGWNQRKPCGWLAPMQNRHRSCTRPAPAPRRRCGTRPRPQATATSIAARQGHRAVPSETTRFTPTPSPRPGQDRTNAKTTYRRLLRANNRSSAVEGAASCTATESSLLLFTSGELLLQ